MGNPHFVIFVEDFPEGWQRQAALIQTQPQFPKERMWCMRRCAVPTKSRSVCLSGERARPVLGTGSCASAVAAIASGRISSR